MPDLEPTDEQVAAIDGFGNGLSLVLEAGAGTGKTSTLKMMAKSVQTRGIYVAYNTSIATEARARFPHNVDCRTAHSLAFRDIGHIYKDRLGGAREPLWKVAKKIGLDYPVTINGRHLKTSTLARLAMEMVGNYCNSADPEITKDHRPYVDGLIEVDDDGKKIVDHHHELAEILLPAARRAWVDLQKVEGGTLSFSHDHYLKMWQLGNPVLEADFVLFDEAQDANPVIVDVVRRQQAQLAIVGDRAQAIYGWRGAVDSLDQFDVDEHLLLSQSFRFGWAIAEEANLWLEMLDTPLRLRGYGKIASRLEEVPHPRALLCRSNAGTIEALMKAQEDGKPAILVGGGAAIASFCKGVSDLRYSGYSTHRDLMAFTSWGEVQDYVEEAGSLAGELGTWVKIIDKYGVDALVKAVENMAKSEEAADIVISTAHKAKGREWVSVRLSEDFSPRRSTDPDDYDEEEKVRPLTPADVMLRYVAVTRAIKLLDLGPLTYQEDDEEDADQ